MILFSIKSLNIRGGGAERVFVDIVNGLYQRGRNVGVLTFDYPGESFYPLAHEVPRFDLSFHPIGASLPISGLIQAAPRTRRIVHELAPDVLVGFMHSTYVPLAFVLAGICPPLIASEHTDARHYDLRPAQRFLRRFADRRAQLRTVPSHAVLPGYQGDGSVETVVVPNPVAVDTFRDVVDTPPADPPEIVCVGRLMAEKDQATLVRAFASLIDRYPEWRLRLIGDGPDRPALEALVAEYGLGHRVSLAGATRDVAAAYAAASFVVVPSRYESFGMVAAESLAAGRPVVSFDDCAGVCEIVKDGLSGIVVRGHADPDRRAEILATGMERLMKDPELRSALGRAGPENIRSYGLEAVLDRWEKVIEHVASSAHRALVTGQSAA